MANRFAPTVENFCNQVNGEYGLEGNTAACQISRGSMIMKIAVGCAKAASGKLASESLIIKGGKVIQHRMDRELGTCTLVALVDVNGKRFQRGVLNNLDEIEVEAPSGPRWLDFGIHGYSKDKSNRLVCRDTDVNYGCIVETKNTSSGVMVNKR